MRKIKNIVYVIVTIMLVVPFISVVAQTKDVEKEYFKADETLVVEEDIKHSLFVAGNKVTSNSKVDGILFLAGNSVKTKNNLEYGMLAGNLVSITSDVEKDLFAAGNIIDVEGKIARDAYLTGNSISVSNDIAGNLFAASSSVELYNTTIKGNVYLRCDNIIIKDDVVIEGTLKYNEDANVTGLDEAKISETETYKIEDVKDEELKINLVSSLISTISLIVVALVICAIYPSIYKKLNKELSFKRVLKKLLYGLCILVVVPFISILILITVIGIPLSIITLLLYGICVYLSIAVSSTVIGNLVLTKLFKKKDNMWLSIIIGIVLIKIICLIPYLGGIVYFLLMLVGLGLTLELLSRK